LFIVNSLLKDKLRRGYITLYNHNLIAILVLIIYYTTIHDVIFLLDTPCLKTNSIVLRETRIFQYFTLIIEMHIRDIKSIPEEMCAHIIIYYIV